MERACRVVCLDFEATSLAPDSFPIEAGWAVADLDAGAVTDEGAVLIVPPPDVADWSRQAEETHGISRTELFHEGVPPAVALDRLENRLHGVGDGLLIADSDLDSFWLRRLAAAAGPRADGRPRPQWRIESFYVRLGRLSGDLARTRRLLEQMATDPAPHRAQADARLLADTLLRAVHGAR